MLRRAAAVIVLVVAVAACTSNRESTVPPPRPPGTPLFDGFAVAPGSRLMGPVFIDAGQSIAVLTVDSDPVRVYDEYAAQARRLGLPVHASGRCSTARHPVGSSCGMQRSPSAAFPNPNPRSHDRRDPERRRSSEHGVAGPPANTTRNQRDQVLRGRGTARR
jgi:hypothetical protein